jgi:pimeloyl-ACP methyl ester carboxylesterase
MRKSLLLSAILAALLAVSFTVTSAQTATPLPTDEAPQSDVVTLTAPDGLTLYADYYALPDSMVSEDGAPAVLLLHMIGARRESWEPLIVPLQASGYQILAPDMRGFGETGGAQDYPLAQEDAGLWLDWLSVQDGVDSSAIGIVGASIGANYALLVCAETDSCVTAVALSPGLDYRGVQPESAFAAGLADRSVLLLGSWNDGASARDVFTLAAAGRGEIGMRMYPGSAHGTALFSTEGQPVIDLIVNWLNENLQVQLAP